MELSAIILVPNDTAKTGFPLPTLLQKVYGHALLSWLSEALYADGIGRFFLVCHEQFVEQARKCLPKDAQIMTSADRGAGLGRKAQKIFREGFTGEVFARNTEKVYLRVLKKGAN